MFNQNVTELHKQIELKVKFCLRFVQVYRSPSIFLIHQEEKRVVLKPGDRLISSRSKNK